MSLINDQVRALRDVAQEYSNNGLEKILNAAADTIEEAIYFLDKLFNAIPAEAESDLYLLSETLTNLNIVKNHIEDEEGYEKIYKLRPYKEREV